MAATQEAGVQISRNQANERRKTTFLSSLWPQIKIVIDVLYLKYVQCPFLL